MEQLFIKRIRKWGGILVNGVWWGCMAFVVFLLAQLFVATSFKIPSDSMEPSLLAGDYILVDKCSGGARLFDVWDAVEGKEVAIHRMPGWRDINRNDVLVFNFPYPGRWDSIALDVMTYYVKRCIAVPGDTLEIQDCRYRVKGYDGPLGDTHAQDDLLALIASGEAGKQGVVLEGYSRDKGLGWSIAQFGPLYVPGKGSVVEMTPLNRRIYANLIEWEQKKKLMTEGDDTLLGDSVIRSYRFRENYYFVSGDKLANSKDSRYWGLLPEPFIVGRAWRIWKSKGENGIRWGRIFRKIE